MLWDNQDRYGAVTRTLHWGIAALMAWQFGGMLSESLLGDKAPLAVALTANHTQVGTILFVLIVLRVVWAPLTVIVARRAGRTCWAMRQGWGMSRSMR